MSSFQTAQGHAFCCKGSDRIYEMRCLFVAVGPNARFIVTGITCHRPTQSHYNDTGPTSYVTDGSVTVHYDFPVLSTRPPVTFKLPCYPLAKDLCLTPFISKGQVTVLTLGTLLP